jgi:hypothetical protein
MNEGNRWIITIGLIASLITIFGFVTGIVSLDKLPRIKTTKSSGAGQVSLKTLSPRIIGNLSFDYDAAVYDAYYTDPPHWKITQNEGYMEFTFNGSHEFSFNALGSTIEGVSYCHINLYINDNLVWTNKFIEKNWGTYKVSSSAFSSGRNKVRIESVGRTHFWIDGIWTS